ncbi:ATR-interacting protein mus304 [Scaptodrosophila lebanonensis]|uniref:ATR-interacting protein mus304 n=1 Tax=Drosophila lebanonensis TaxID=7225 RepID=A0A6J2U951_DROLE|nr:ATR-interacting protein mus304 [Scaptodrosophila lebanonensis]
MAKRFQPMKDFARAKKPKLDLSISRGRPEPTHASSSSNNNNHGSSNKCASKQHASPVHANGDDFNFWDDDDDDVILLATQKAEAAAGAGAGRPNQADGIFSEIDMTFSDFAPKGQGTTSTQQMFAVPASKPLKNDMDIMFDDDDDFELLAVVEKKVEVKLPEEPPPPPVAIPSTNKAEPAQSISVMSMQVLTQSTAAPSQSTVARRQLAQERQMKFLMERVEALKQENVKLQKDLFDTKDRIESKDGEASLLRDELRHLRHQLEASKMEKLKIAESAKAECKTKVAEVFKQITAKETELKLRDVEYSKLKLRHTTQTKQFEMSMCVEENTSVLIIDAISRRNLMRMRNLSIGCFSNNKNITSSANGSVFELTKDDAKGKKQLFQLELEHLLLSYAQLQSQCGDIEDITSRIIQSVCKVFLEFWSHVHSLEFPHNCVVYPYHNYALQSDESAPQRQSLAQPSALFSQERAISLRRYIATLALICQQQRKLAHALLHHKHGEYWLLQIANDAIAKLGYSDELCEHFGLLEAAGALLHSLLVYVNEEEVPTEIPQLELLFDLLKQLAFTRPTPWIFRELSASLLACTRQSQLMSRMCVNSPKECFLSDRVRSLYRFGPDSCLLQVYAGLLELAFFSEVKLELAHFNLLLVICQYHVRFVYQCFTNPPAFILEMLPSVADDDDEENDVEENTLTNGTSMQSATTLSNSSNGTTTLINKMPTDGGSNPERRCECYVKLCLSVVTLVFQMLHQWMLCDREHNTSQVSEISQIAVHLLTLIFREYYLTCLFRDSEETTKHYLSLICNWWSEHLELLGFQEIHVRFLRHLQDSHFMLKPLHREANPSNPTNDLQEWTRIVSNADAKVEKYDDPDDPFNCNPLAATNTRQFFDGLKRHEDNVDSRLDLEN